MHSKGEKGSHETYKLPVITSVEKLGEVNGLKMGPIHVLCPFTTPYKRFCHFG